MNKQNKKMSLLRFLVVALIVILPLSGLGCKGVSTEVQEQLKAVSIEVWGVYVDSDELEPLFNIYRQSHPYVSFNYRKFRPEEYEAALIDALAEDRGPDIFMVHNSQVGEYLPKLSPMPAQISLPIITVEGSLKPEQVITMRTMASLSTGQLRQSFVEVVGKDVIYPNETTGMEEIYAMPLSMDTMVLYYNNDLLNRANIPEPPATWTDLQNMVELLTKFDAVEGITQSAIALGLANNVENYFDILSLLMMQNGTVMVDERGNVQMDKIPAAIADQIDISPALNALDFYSSFAKSYKVNYTWDDYMLNSMEEFAAGNTAMFLGYQYHDEMIKALAPKLNYSIASAPQVNPEYPVNYANYWLYGVSKKSDAQNVSWDFLQNSAQSDVVKYYLERSGEVTVLKSLINAQQTDDLAVFANQILTAQSWYRGMDLAGTKEEFANLIGLAVGDSYEESLYKELVDTSRRINNTYSR